VRAEKRLPRRRPLRHGREYTRTPLTFRLGRLPKIPTASTPVAIEKERNR
jgi:hypothetical protein